MNRVVASLVVLCCVVVPWSAAAGLGLCIARRRHAPLEKRSAARRNLLLPPGEGRGEGAANCRFIFMSLLALSVCAASAARGDTFGSGANTFDIEFVSIGNPGNAADDISANPDFAGSVAYTYRMGKFEISEQMIVKANAEGGLGITKDTRGADKPATSVSWNEAARFVNWLNTSTGSTRAYKFALQPGEVGYNANAKS